MLISKLAQALGEGAICCSFCCGAVQFWGLPVSTVNGKALSDKLSELP